MMEEQFTSEIAYKQMYLTLFNQVSLALEALQRRDYGTAEAILQNAQAKTEEIYMNADMM